MMFRKFCIAAIAVAWGACTCAGLAFGQVIVVSDDFSTDTRSNYTDLSFHGGFTARASTDWTVSGGTLNLLATQNTHGMLAFEDGSNNLLATPEHFSIAFSFTPTIPIPGVPGGSNDHPGIVFDRTATDANVFYIASFNNNARITRSSASYGAEITQSFDPGVLADTKPYDLVFEVDYGAQTATVSVFDIGGGPLLDTATFTGTDFTSKFGTSSAGGAFGLIGWNTEGASFDNLVVTDFTQSASVVPEPTSLTIWGLLATALAAVVWRSRRKFIH